MKIFKAMAFISYIPISFNDAFNIWETGGETPLCKIKSSICFIGGRKLLQWYVLFIIFKGKSSTVYLLYTKGHCFK